MDAIYRSLFAEATPGFVARAFQWTQSCFAGGCPGYQAIDADYHDLEHTLQGALCFARLLQGRFLTGAVPLLTRPVFELGLLAILMHDTGYLKQSGDTQGTGAKYTAVHVSRSGDFAAQFLGHKGYGPREIQAVRDMILCTGVNVNLRAIPFQDGLERLAGYALGTADLLGQMAADNYVEKLAELFDEFQEAASFSEKSAGFVGLFHSAEELMRRTPQFWQEYVLPKLHQDFEGVFQFLSRPCPGGPNWYLERAQSNVDRLRRLYPARAI